MASKISIAGSTEILGCFKLKEKKINSECVSDSNHDIHTERRVLKDG